MPTISPIPAITFRVPAGGDLSAKIAPPYDVLDAASKAELVRGDPHNIVVVDLPFLPPKTVGPDPVYVEAGQRFAQWLDSGVLVRRSKPAVFVYCQTYTVKGTTYKRRGLITNVKIQPFGVNADGAGAIRPHEQTFSAAKEDRLKLMRATHAQLSPIFGLYADPKESIGALLAEVIARGPADMRGTTRGDQVHHEAWIVEDPAGIAKFTKALRGRDIFIADGHHRYNTAMNYRSELVQQRGSDLPPDHPANNCLFVLVSMQDPGMIVLPTHRVLGGMNGFDMRRFAKAAEGKFHLTPFKGKDLAALEAALPTHPGALPGAGAHGIGLYIPSNQDQPMWIATTVKPDPLAATHGDRAAAWRQLDVAIVQHLLVEGICQPTFAHGKDIAWKFPHQLDELRHLVDSGDYQLGVIVQPTPLEAVRQVSEAAELMPQKSTFFYPKLATGLVINPLN